jgi:2-keto-3-deoxy-L-rhamnonate aldolase RhmA
MTGILRNNVKDKLDCAGEIIAVEGIDIVLVGLNDMLGEL